MRKKSSFTHTSVEVKLKAVLEILEDKKANAVCLSIAETAISNGIDFYEYLKKLLTDLPNLEIHQNPEILDQYMPWSKMIQAECSN